MVSFAHELSERFLANERYWSLLSKLQSAGVTETLNLRPEVAGVEPDDLAKLLYCAEVFVQTDDESLHKQAQEISIHALLIAADGQVRERALALLTELGNFPGLKYAEQHYGGGDETLLGLINRRVSEQLSMVRIGEEVLPLTAYQRKVWRSLPSIASAAVTAPTSAGKSFLVLEHLCRRAEAEAGFVAVYVTPTRALLSEVHQKVQARLKARTDIRVSAVPSLDNTSSSTGQVFVLTQERLSTLLSVSGGSLMFNLVVVDEAQNIADDARGMILQDCLERIAAMNPDTQVILLAPGAVGMPEVAKSFGITDLVPLATRLSPVLQNRIVLSKVPRKPLELSMAVMGKGGVRTHLGVVRVERSLAKPSSRLAHVAIELGGDEGSLLYETGAREAEKTSELLMSMLKARDGEPKDASLEELSKFIQEHVHPEYQLASMVRYGVAYHYGRMPSLLREAIENSFKREEGGLRYLVCTTTLAQGVNLPARNVFIDTPKRGAGKPLDPALLWNFAGRAGRLNHDIVGNVFLLNYEDWDTKPMDEFVPFHVKPAVAETLRSHHAELTAALRLGELPVEHPHKPQNTRIRACAGLLVAHAARNDVGAYLSRALQSVGPEMEELAVAAQDAYTSIGLPDYILVENWTIDPFGLRRLYDFAVRKIREGDIEQLIPQNPMEAPNGHYQTLFGHLMAEVYGRNHSFGALAGGLAIQWMKGVPYPAILQIWVKNRRKAEERAEKQALAEGKTPAKPKTLDNLIYRAFELIEDVVRFQFVQLGKAYREILLLALRNTDNSERVPDVYDFALALELGISSQAGTAYVELGLSRIAASALEARTPPDIELTAAVARKLLRDMDLEAAQLSPIIVDELRRLGLVTVEGPADQPA